MSHSRWISTVVAVLTMATGLAIGPAIDASASNLKNVRPTGIEITPIDEALSVSWSGAIGSSTVNGYTVTATHPGQVPVSCLAENPTTVCYLGGRLVNGKHYEVRVQPGDVTSGPHGTQDFTPVGKPSKRIKASPTAAQNCSYIGESANLQGCDLSNANLSGASLAQADMVGTNLTNANLTNAGLQGADLQGAILTGVNLSSAYFNDTNLSDDTLTGLEVPNAIFQNTDLAGFDLAGADMAGVGMNTIDLDGTNLTNVDLVGGTIGASSMVDTNLTDGNLTDAELVGDNMTGADFAGATLAGVDWANSTCPDGTSSSSDGGTCAGNLG